ncbi:uncharacterized protein BO96DRAFT_428767 [Aspergillus niger CBS 101883]|uniref:Secreted protein n=3 Tax=Aspergillus niger TaxID=5061 RepID=A2QXE4_ASPNC|nr:uncharacterized protein BO96DRAFT_428767 [Aspergillus niger CBS 101883]XP_059604367.1 hypothetical protein An11g08630 [Aspergillus niger]PYH62031.1 hypothetical protein BO96DRAFT_428767 [Aspergillus niger CBS 101883]RDH16355.1 hypothetical protein M747DRAFT_317881 [Aspergillus niger ATCC 13496]CAK46052.1 hypothetical protein An11g08630 [Aspergillus niger]
MHYGFLLLVSVGRFGCFGYGAASRRECSVFERSLVSIPVLSDASIVLPTRVSGSLREFYFVTFPVRYPLRGCGVSIRPSVEGLAQALFERLVFSFCSLVPDVCRYPFEGAVYLSRYRVSLREFDGLLDLVPALLESLVALSQPLSPSGLRVILADVGEYTSLFPSIMPCQHTDDNISVSLRGSGLQPLAVSPRESGLLLVCACAGSLREFRLVIFSIDRLNPPPPSVSVSPPVRQYASWAHVQGSGAARQSNLRLDTHHMMWPAMIADQLLHRLKQEYGPVRCQVP